MVKKIWTFFLLYRAKITEGLLLMSIKGIPDAISAFPELEQLWATVLNQLGYNQDSETATPFQEPKTALTNTNQTLKHFKNTN